MNMNEEELVKENDELFAKIKSACDQLFPFFDSIQIFVTKHEGNKMGTSSFIYGTGNFYARYGQIELWTKEQSLLDDGKDEC